MTHPFDQLDWPVRTERLMLRRVIPDDLDAIWSYLRLPEVREWLGIAVSEYDAYRERYLRPGRLEDKLIVELGERQVIGHLELNIQDGWAQADVADQAKGVQASLGWTFDPRFHGRGYATEAVRAVIDLCFGPLGLRRVIAECFADNEPSWRLMDRLGMRREQHTVKESLHRTKGWLDGYTYALLAEEWPRS
jgi:RimJ/RimL family protein N-acetyltransferase